MHNHPFRMISFAKLTHSLLASQVSAYVRHIAAVEDADSDDELAEAQAEHDAAQLAPCDQPDLVPSPPQPHADPPPPANLPPPVLAAADYIQRYRSLPAAAPDPHFVVSPDLLSEKQAEELDFLMMIKRNRWTESGYVSYLNTRRNRRSDTGDHKLPAKLQTLVDRAVR